LASQHEKHTLFLPFPSAGGDGLLSDAKSLGMGSFGMAKFDDVQWPVSIGLNGLKTSKRSRKR
jgi:hypothetical protein